ncbi:MAG: hypothetical protein AAGD33_00125 [Actinomycetota bacterium]
MTSVDTIPDAPAPLPPPPPPEPKRRRGLAALALVAGGAAAGVAAVAVLGLGSDDPDVESTDADAVAVDEPVDPVGDVDSEPASDDADGAAAEPMPDPTPATVADGDFVATFDTAASLDDFRLGVYHRNVDVHDAPNDAGGEWLADHSDLGDGVCGPPTETRPVSFDPAHTQQERIDNTFYVCDVSALTGAVAGNHLMTTMGDVDAYSVVWFSPDATFDSHDTVSWDVNVTDLGGRQWWEVAIVPADFSTDRPTCPQCSRIDWLDAADGLPVYPDGAIVVGNGPFGGDIRITTEGVDQEVSPHYSLCERSELVEPCSLKPPRLPFSIIDDGEQIVVDIAGVESYTVPGSFPDEFVVVFKDHNYTPDKEDDACLAPGNCSYTWHWDNIMVTAS